MKFEKLKYSVQEIEKEVEKKYFVFYPTLNSPEMDMKEFDFIIESILNTTFPENFPIYTIEYNAERVNLYHSSSLISKMMNFIKSSEFKNLEGKERALIKRYKFEINYLIDYNNENEALEFLDNLQKVKRF